MASANVRIRDIGVLLRLWAPSGAAPADFKIDLSRTALGRPFKSGLLLQSLVRSEYGHDVTKTTPPTTLAEFELLVMVAAMRLGGDEAHAVSIAADITE